MSTFDATSHSDQDGAAHARPDYAADDAAPMLADEPIATSTLDDLREAGRQTDDREPITVTNPRDTIRLTLRTDFPQKDLQRWQWMALPLKHREQLRRRGGQPNLSLVDPIVMFAAAVADTCIQVEVRSRATGQYRAVVNEHNGEPLTFADGVLRQQLGAMDTPTAVRHAFNRSDPALLDAGARLIEAAGFGDGDTGLDGADGDPTTATG